MDDGIKIVLARLIVIAGAFLFFGLGINWMYGALLFAWLMMTFLILRTYDDWGTFLKRSFLTFPFIAITELNMFMFLQLSHYTYWYTAAIIFDALILRVPKILSHYIITLFLTVLSLLLIANKGLIGHDFYTCSTIFLTFFSAGYLLILNRNKDKYVFVLLKSLISGTLATMFIWAFMLSDRMIEIYDISFGYTYAFSCFLGLVFFIVFYVLGKKYFKANNLFKKGKILEPIEKFFLRNK